MRILIIFVLTVTVCYAKNNQLKSPLFRCNPFQKTGVDSPFEQGPFNFMKPYENFSLEDMPGEVWTNFPFSKNHLISNLGRGKSLARKTLRSDGSYLTVKEKILSQWMNHQGYCMFSVKGNKKKRHWSAHRAVMTAFFGPSELVIDHLDSDKKNNYLFNLQYVTTRENVRRHFKKILKMPLGVRMRSTGKYQAELRIGKQLHVLGNYKTIEEAVDIHTKASNDLGNIHLYAKVTTKRKKHDIKP